MLEVLRQRLEGLSGFEEDVEDIASVQRSVAETIAGMDRILQAERLRRHRQVGLHEFVTALREGQ
jgi:hypothetical protein